MKVWLARPRGGDIRDNFIWQDSKDDGPEHLESNNQDVVAPALRDRTAVPERDMGSQDPGGLPVTHDRPTIVVGHSGTATADTHSETQQNTGTGKSMDNPVNTGGDATTAGGTHRKYGSYGRKDIYAKQCKQCNHHNDSCKPVRGQTLSRGGVM